ncbi:hypothetical protein OFN48_34385, partial [Escherichia coli]|nr:hypothetical protein [Escherichia coli]
RKPAAAAQAQSLAPAITVRPFVLERSLRLFDARTTTSRSCRRSPPVPGSSPRLFDCGRRLRPFAPQRHPP